MIRPTKSKVVYYFEEKEDKTSGGIIFNDKQKASIGVVVNTGPDVKDVKEGDRFIADYRTAQVVDEKLLIIDEEHIQIVIE